MNKFTLVMLLVFLGQSFTFFAQNNSAKDLEYEKKVTYLKEKLKLTDEIAVKFWPVYQQKYLDLKANSRYYKNLKINKKLSEMSDEECKKMMENKFAKETKELEIDKLYHEKFIAILGYKKTAKLYKEEGDYKDLMKQNAPSKNSSKTKK